MAQAEFDQLLLQWVFCTTWSFRNPSNMLILCWFCTQEAFFELLNVFVETVIHFYRILCWIESSVNWNIQALAKTTAASSEEISTIRCVCVCVLSWFREKQNSGDYLAAVTQRAHLSPHAPAWSSGPALSALCTLIHPRCRRDVTSSVISVAHCCPTAKLHEDRRFTPALCQSSSASFD